MDGKACLPRRLCAVAPASLRGPQRRSNSPAARAAPGPRKLLMRTATGLRFAPACLRAVPSAIDLTPVADGHHQHHEPVILDGGHDAVVVDAIAPEPEPFAIPGQ